VNNSHGGIVPEIREITLLMLSFPNAKHWGVTHALSSFKIKLFYPSMSLSIVEQL
jgi:hypothetical protein